MTGLDEVLQTIDLEDTKACAVWTSNQKNDADFKKYTEILKDMNKERDELNIELTNWFDSRTYQP